ncbi:MAG TPA: hypothetical protein VFK69_14820, partial [Candidatus Eisenbacteria bacterium]|nr:hypothetical protein [Candidatus Eisenbacteria bacterium]
MTHAAFWRRPDWLDWLPVAVVAAGLIEPLAPLRAHGRFGTLPYVNLVMAGVAMVAVARALALRRRLLPPTSFDRVLLPLLVVSALGVLPPAHRAQALHDFGRCLLGVSVFYATATVASRRGGARRVWPAFPLAAAVVGAHALASLAGGPGGVARQTRAADQAWQCTGGLVATLWCALPVSLALAWDAGEPGARRAWRIAAVVGVAGALVHVALGHPDAGAAVARLEDPVGFASLALSWVALFMFARTAWRMSRLRPHESPRWRALSATFVLTGGLQLGMDVLAAPTAALLLGIGGGLAAGAWRAARSDIER